jgi:hypothetical protein
MASISARTKHLTGSIIQPAIRNIDRTASEVWTGHLQNPIISISRYTTKAPLKFNFGLGDDSMFEDHSPILGSQYISDMFKCIQFILPQLQF